MSAAPVCLNLVVIRSADLDRAEKFYSHLGISFERHRHGKGLDHLASTGFGTVFEIYPLTSSTPSTIGTRIGFSIDAVEKYIDKIPQLGGRVVTPVKDSEWGRRAVIEDPDGHKVELLTPPNRNTP